MSPSHHNFFVRHINISSGANHTFGASLPYFLPPFGCRQLPARTLHFNQPLLRTVHYFCYFICGSKKEGGFKHHGLLFQQKMTQKSVSVILISGHLLCLQILLLGLVLYSNSVFYYYDATKEYCALQKIRDRTGTQNTSTNSIITPITMISKEIYRTKSFQYI